MSPPPPSAAKGESARLAALRRYEVLDTPPEPEFDDLVALAAELCSMPMAALSLVDAGRLFLKAQVGVGFHEVQRSGAPCARVVDCAEALVVPDTLEDSFLCRWPLATGTRGVRAYLGAPLISPDGFALGTLCVLDVQPRELSETHVRTLQRLARQAVHLLELRLSNRRLTEANAFNRATMDALVAPVAVVETDGTMLAVNRAWEQLAARPAAVVWQMPAQPGANLLTQCDRAGGDGASPAALASAVRAVTVQGAEDGRCELCFGSPGQEFWFQVQVTRSAAANPLRAVVTLEEVTAQRRTERLVRESEERLRATLESSPHVAVQWYDSGGRVQYWNAASESMFGWSRQEAEGRTLDALILTPEQAAAFHGILGTVARTGQACGPEESPFRRRDGSTGWCRSTVFPIPGPAGGAQFVCMDVEITAQRAAQEELRRSEHFREQVLQTAPVITYVFDLAEQRDIFSSRSTLASLGFTSEAIASLGDQFLTTLLHPVDLARLPAMRARWDTAADGDVLTTEYRMRSADGSWRWFLGSDTVFQRDADGRVRQIIGTALDITARRVAEEALQATLEGTTQVGADFFSGLVCALGTTLKVRYALVGELRPDRPGWVRTVAAWADGTPAESFEFELAGSPCHEVLRQGFCYFPEHVGEQFTDDPVLAQLGASAYIGARLCSASGQTLGLLVVMHDQPLPFPQKAHELVRIFSSRAAAELERIQTERRARQVSRTLEILTEVNETITRTSDARAVLETACRAGVVKGGFPLVWIGLRDRPGGAVQVAAQAGADPETDALLTAALRGEPSGGACWFTTAALRGESPAVCQEVATDPRMALWQKAALDRGYRSLVSLALHRGGEVIGCLNFYATAPGQFPAEELALLEELAADLSFGLEVCEREAARRRTEADLLAAHHRYRALVNDVDAIVWECELKRKTFTFVSAQAERLLGYPARDWLGDPGFWPALIHPEDRERALGFCQFHTQRKESHDFEYRMRAADGRWLWIHDYVSVVVEDGRPVSLRGLMVDVTGRRQQEQVLRDEQRLNSTLIENVAGLFFVFNRAGRMLRWNHTITEKLGYTDAEIGRRTPQDFVVPAQHRRCIAAIAKTFAEGQAEVELDLVGTDGQSSPYFLVARSLEFAGEPVLVGLGFDLRERRAAEAEIRRLAAFPALNPQPVLEFADDGSVTYHNRATDDFARELQLGLADLLPDGLPEILAGSLATGHPILRQEVERAQRTLVWSFFPMRELGRVHGYVTDITEEVHREKLARRSQRMESIGTLAGGIAHDLNNTLTPVLMGLHLFRQDHPEAGELADTIEQGVRRAADMTRKLLTFARGAEGRREPVLVDQLVTEMETFIRGTFPKEITLALDLPAGLPAVKGDPTQIYQVLLNLCVNARDALPATGGRLLIAAHPIRLGEQEAARFLDGRPGEFVCVAVEDTGAGIARGDLERIFDPFFTTKGPDGTGLGLSTALGIVRGHGGFVHVTSTPGRGSRFEVFLPAAGAAEPSPPLAPPVPHTQGGEQVVLFVDDELPILHVAALLLQRLGYVPLTSPGGAAALEQLGALDRPPAVIITDLHMPGMDGLTFARTVRERWPDIPVVVASGRLDEPVAAAFRALGVQHRLDKPFESQQLSTTLVAALAGMLAAPPR